VPRARRIGVPGRLDSQGQEVQPLDAQAIEAALAAWDDTAAAEAHRLAQARGLIRCVVYVHDPDGAAVALRAYVSVSTDRTAGAGYAATANVLKSPTDAEIVLRDLQADLGRLRRKYERWRHVVAVAGVLDKLGDAAGDVPA